MASAAKSVASNAAETLKQVGKNDSKILLTVQLEAPKLILPKNSMSTEAIILDLGLVTLMNKLNVEATTLKDKSAVVDNLIISLERLTLSRLV